MGIVRVLHTSDLHLGLDPLAGTSAEAACSTLDKVLRAGARVHADLLIIAGDLFDSSRVPDVLVQSVVSSFRSSPLPVVILPGNHDCLVPESVYSRHCLPELAPNVTVIADPDGEVVHFASLDLSLWGKPHTSYADFNPLQGMPQRGSQKWQIGIAHGYYVDAEAQSNRGWQITDADICASNRDYIALGHLEVFNKVGTNGVQAYYSGSPRIMKAVALVELDTETGLRVSKLPLES
ncbi:MAG: metallophosphoesterase [Chloroflexi bacterium]|nr:metallophosphoesterase [Chloroflexota bacterium]